MKISIRFESVGWEHPGLGQLDPTFAMADTALDLAGAITILTLRRGGEQASFESAFTVAFRALRSTTFTVVTLRHIEFLPYELIL